MTLKFSKEECGKVHRNSNFFLLQNSISHGEVKSGEGEAWQCGMAADVGLGDNVQQGGKAVDHSLEVKQWYTLSSVSICQGVGMPRGLLISVTINIHQLTHIAYMAQLSACASPYIDTGLHRRHIFT